MSKREKGVATTVCPTCGHEVAIVTAPDGALTAEACPTCHSSSTPEKAKAQTPSREHGTTTTEEPSDG